MYKTKLCLGTNSQFGVSEEEQIKLFKKTGFEGFFTLWSEQVGKNKELAEKLGMEYQSVHAPWTNAANMWTEGEKAEEAKKELLRCVEDCAKYDVPILVVHPYIGFEKKDDLSDCGVENFRVVVERAKELGVKIAFENVEGEEYLERLMKEFKSYENVGFCWDSGHEQCYNRGRDMLALYGDRLIATHLNDNLGVRDYDGKITWIDDLHLLPFEGIVNWQKAVDRLNKCGFDGILTFELNKLSKPERFENEGYKNLSLEEYIAKCYAAACRVANLKSAING